MKLAKAIETVPSSSEVIDDRLASFCDSRGMDEWVAKAAGLYVKDEGDYKGWLAIPYPHLTGTWGERYRRLVEGRGPKYMDVQGAELHLYNPQHLGPQSREVWFTEGEIDALILWQYGVPAIGMSGSSKYGHELFQEAWKLLFNRATVVIAVDNDEAGHKAANDIERAFRRVKRFDMPEGMDINDYHLKEGDTMRRQIDALRS